ncbi:M1 family metallopeptidase [Actinomadura rupiterrae]|uniref:M1 family metallopeptidase n=1 Tax=Actinomadura rupiterrae TaxID=559627 RepID=UPI0020A2362C|nr:M1 family metallopeptidase [Actinomadura rupiterrae]MCP2340073.1 aminopeptidase N [Actinomadura rupiterrae]
MPPRTSTRTRVAASLTASACLLAVASPASADARPRFAPGAAGVGDRYFPLEGNGGYDVLHYDLGLDYTPSSNALKATATLSARATQNLSRFDLDLKQLKVTSVKVNGKRARFARKGQELVVTPAKGLRKGHGFTVAVAYGGDPKPVNRPDIGKYGWIRTPDGAYAVSEPDGGSSWFPSNDHPSDKATYTFRVTVPNGTQVLSNGERSPVVTKGGRSTFTWNERTPMASYLAMLAIGKYQTLTGRTKTGVPVLTGASPNRTTELKALHENTIKAIDWEETVFGKYPFRSVGGIRVGVDVDFSLETQGRPIYGFSPDMATVVHELAHQWFGDTVSVRRWPDIWLNEGFATYAEWLYDEQHGGPTAQATFDKYYNQPKSWKYYDALWNRNTAGDPGAQTMFTVPPYYRGGMTLQALRVRIGDRAFFALLKTWVAQHRNGDVSTPEFVRLAEKISHKKLDGLFRTWLYTKGKPAKW